jgi:hypothetical protein
VQGKGTVIHKYNAFVSICKSIVIASFLKWCYEIIIILCAVYIIIHYSHNIFTFQREHVDIKICVLCVICRYENETETYIGMRTKEGSFLRLGPRLLIDVVWGALNILRYFACTYLFLQKFSELWLAFQLNIRKIRVRLGYLPRN